jgi:hypothetical protein
MNGARRGFALPGARFLFSYSWYSSNSLYSFFLRLSVTSPELIS